MKGRDKNGHIGKTEGGGGRERAPGVSISSMCHL